MIDNTVIEDVSYTKFLGMFVDDELTWTDYIDSICKKVSTAIYPEYTIDALPNLISWETTIILYPMLRAYVGEIHRNWDHEIPKIGFALRTAKSEITGYSPTFLNLGCSK